MSTSQVLDRTFSLYRRNFLLFAGIAAVPPALLLLGQLGFVAAGSMAMLSRRPELQIAGIVAAVLTGIVLVGLWLIGYALATGASVYAVTRVHLGHATSIAEAYKLMFPSTGTILGIVVLEFLAVAGVVIAVMVAIAVPLILLGVVSAARAPAASGLLAALGFLFVFPLLIGPCAFPHRQAFSCRAGGRGGAPGRDRQPEAQLDTQQWISIAFDSRHCSGSNHFVRARRGPFHSLLHRYRSGCHKQGPFAPAALRYLAICCRLHFPQHRLSDCYHCSYSYLL